MVKSVVVLAFSGGLDTSFGVPSLKETGYEVVTVTVNGKTLPPLELMNVLAANTSRSRNATGHAGR